MNNRPIKRGRDSAPTPHSSPVLTRTASSTQLSTLPELDIQESKDEPSAAKRAKIATDTSSSITTASHTDIKSPYSIPNSQFLSGRRPHPSIWNHQPKLSLTPSKLPTPLATEKSTSAPVLSLPRLLLERSTGESGKFSPTPLATEESASAPVLSLPSLLLERSTGESGKFSPKR